MLTLPLGLVTPPLLPVPIGFDLAGVGFLGSGFLPTGLVIPPLLPVPMGLFLAGLVGFLGYGFLPKAPLALDIVS